MNEGKKDIFNVSTKSQLKIVNHDNYVNAFFFVLISSFLYNCDNTVCSER